MRWFFYLCLLLLNATFATGCNAFTDAQLQLVEQARRGLELEKQSAVQRAEFVKNYYQLQRNRLDSAFDADVREAGSLSKDWIIEHRRAYAAALDVIHHQQTVTAEAEAISQRNRAAIDAALERLRALISIFERGK